MSPQGVCQPRDLLGSRVTVFLRKFAVNSKAFPVISEKEAETICYIYERGDIPSSGRTKMALVSGSSSVVPIKGVGEVGKKNGFGLKSSSTLLKKKGAGAFHGFGTSGTASDEFQRLPGATGEGRVFGLR